MNILFLSHDGDLLGIAMRCKSEGFSVLLHVLSDERGGCIGRGIVDRVDFDERLVKRNGECIATNVNRLLSFTLPNLIVLDSNSLGKLGDYLREKGLPVFGGSFWSDCLSTNPSYAFQLISRLCCSPPSLSPSLALPLSLSLLWNGSSILSSFLTLNETRFLTGGLGEEVESTGQVLLSKKYLPPFSSLSETLSKMLRKVKFRGMLTLNLAVTETSFLILSFTSHPLYFPSLLEVYKGSVTDLLMSVAGGKRCEGEVTMDVAVSILVSIPPYPHQSKSPAESRVGGVDGHNSSHLYLLDAFSPLGEVERADGDGRVVWATARGRDVREARKRAYKTVRNLVIEKAQYRLDIGEGVEEAIEKVGRCKFKI